MQLSNISSNNFSKTNFKGINIDKSFYDAASYLNINAYTQKGYREALSQLEKASGKKNIVLQGLDELGVNIVEADNRGEIIRHITKGSRDAISAMKYAAKILTKENEPKSTVIRERFPGHGNLRLNG